MTSEAAAAPIASGQTRAARRAWIPGEDLWITRLVFQRALALVYLIAFLVAANQFVPLLGERGLLPVPRFVS